MRNCGPRKQWLRQLACAVKGTANNGPAEAPRERQQRACAHLRNSRPSSPSRDIFAVRTVSLRATSRASQPIDGARLPADPDQLVLV